MQDKTYYDNNDTDPYVIKTTTTRDLLPHSIRLRDECAYRSRSSTPPDLSNIPIYTYSNTDRSTPARSADSHKSPFRTPRRTNLSRTFRTPSRTRSTSVPNKKLFVFVLLKVSFCDSLILVGTEVHELEENMLKHYRAKPEDFYPEGEEPESQYLEDGVL